MAWIDPRRFENCQDLLLALGFSWAADERCFKKGDIVIPVADIMGRPVYNFIDFARRKGYILSHQFGILGRINTD